VLCDKLCGPAKNLTVLATAYSDPAGNGTGEHEPVLFTVDYGKGRVFHTTLGHAKELPSSAMECVGFIVTFQRGAEWAAASRFQPRITAPHGHRSSSSHLSASIAKSLKLIILGATSYRFASDASGRWPVPLVARYPISLGSRALL